MKKYFIITFLLHCFSILLINPTLGQTDSYQFFNRNLSGTLDSGFTSWQWLNPLPQGNDLYRVQMIDSNIIYAIGEYGTFISTTNCVNP